MEVSFPHLSHILDQFTISYTYSIYVRVDKDKLGYGKFKLWWFRLGLLARYQRFKR